jgi:hypothetical protein
VAGAQQMRQAAAAAHAPLASLAPTRTACPLSCLCSVVVAVLNGASMNKSGIALGWAA